jgi:hypothetical protein
VGLQGERAYLEAQGLLLAAPPPAEVPDASADRNASWPSGWLAAAGGALAWAGQAAGARVGGVVGAVGGRASDTVGRFTRVTFPVTSFAYKRIKSIMKDPAAARTAPGAPLTPHLLPDAPPPAVSALAIPVVTGGAPATSDLHTETHADGAKAPVQRAGSTETRVGRLRRLAAYSVGVIPILQMVPAVVRWSQQVQNATTADDEITTWVPAEAVAGDESPPLAHLGDSERYYELWKDKKDSTTTVVTPTPPQPQVRQGTTQSYTHHPF